MSDRARAWGLALLHLLQAAVYAAAAWELHARWWGDAALLAAAAVAQVLGLARRSRLEPILHLVSLACVLAVYARFGLVTLHVERVFGPATGDQAVQIFGASLLVLPWLVAFPVVRLVMRGVPRSAAALPLALIPLAPALLPLGLTDRGDDAERMAAALWSRWSTGSGDVPALEGEPRVRVTVLRDGVAGAATTSSTPAVPPGRPGPRDALLVDVAEGALPLSLLRPGTDAGGADDSPSPTIAARTLARAEVLPGFKAPVGRVPTVRFASAVASAEGTIRLERGWSPPPALDAASIDAALGAAVTHLVHGMTEEGKFTYIVKGPSGGAGPGYNYPRHAGTAWFLARVAAATGNDVSADAADRSLAHLWAVSGHTDDGRAYVLDPDRSDGKSWIGTTALATLALTVRGNDRDALVAYTRQLAAAVDADGKVRGDMRIKDGSFAEQPANPYGQGQVVLALAAAERAGVTDGKDALDRAIRYLDGPYMGTRHPVAVGDEHWMCLAARALKDVRGIDTGAGICAAYAATERWSAPADGGGLPPAAGPGGGAAEALVARAWDTRDPALIDAALAWGRHFLAVQYRPEDAPLLGDPLALIGGFRDGVGSLDVQIDAVQHIGCALLGVEALLSGRARPGSLP